MRNRYAAILCSRGCLDRKLIVLLFEVGFVEDAYAKAGGSSGFGEV